MDGRSEGHGKVRVEEEKLSRELTVGVLKMVVVRVLTAPWARATLTKRFVALISHLARCMYISHVQSAFYGGSRARAPPLPPLLARENVKYAKSRLVYREIVNTERAKSGADTYYAREAICVINRAL